MSPFIAAPVISGTHRLSSIGRASTIVAIIPPIIAMCKGKKKLMHIIEIIKQVRLPSQLFFAMSLCLPYFIPIIAANASPNTCTLSAASTRFLLPWKINNKTSAEIKKNTAAFPGNCFSFSLSTLSTIFSKYGNLCPRVIAMEIITPAIKHNPIMLMLALVPA